MVAEHRIRSNGNSNHNTVVSNGYGEDCMNPESVEAGQGQKAVHVKDGVHAEDVVGTSQQKRNLHRYC